MYLNSFSFIPRNKYFENANILKYWKILPLEFIPKLCNIGWKIFVKFMTLRKFKAKVWAIYRRLVKEYIWPVILLRCHVTWTLKVEYEDIRSGGPLGIYRNFRVPNLHKEKRHGEDLILFFFTSLFSVNIPSGGGNILTPSGPQRSPGLR